MSGPLDKKIYIYCKYQGKRQRSKKLGEVRKNILKGELPVNWREIHPTAGNRSVKAQGWSPAAPIPQKPEFVKAGG